MKRQLAELVNEQVEDLEVVEDQKNLKVEDRARKRKQRQRRWSPQRRALESPEQAQRPLTTIGGH